MSTFVERYKKSLFDAPRIEEWFDFDYDYELDDGIIQGSVVRTLAITKTRTGTVLVKGSSSKTLTISRTRTGTVLVQGSVSRTLSVTGIRTGTIPVRGLVSRIISFGARVLRAILGSSGPTQAQLRKKTYFYFLRRRR